MLKKLKKYICILREIDWWQTYTLYRRVRKPRSSSIRVLNHSVFDIHPTALFEIGERTFFEINRIDYAFDRGRTCRIGMLANSVLAIRGSVTLHRGTSIILQQGARLSIDNQTYLNGASVDCSKEITIGEYCAIAEGVRIMDNSYHPITIDGVTKCAVAPVHIGNHVWIATNAMILPGVTIGDGSIVAAGSVVTRDVAAGCLVAGVPAKVIKTDVKWKK